VELSQLYSKGTRMSEVDPEFKGMRGREWCAKKMIAQCEAYYARQKAAGERPKVANSKIVTPRDEYGMKGLRGR
jgi:hypothetical protein